MADVLSADLLRVEQVAINMLAEYDLIGFGSGVYFGKFHKSLLELVDKLPRLENKKAFIFSTSGLRKMRFIHDFHKPLKGKLKQKGLNIVGEFSCRGFDTSQAAKIIGGINWGRPDEKDLELAENFARGLQDRK
ncbi:unnamed protein product [marine sediment metagenome]|uniref:Flavodoxin domain-containing protein n=1 Tax=marine sediment metagenome TaxID=412755 RepID=X0YKL4_9ZZZZ